MSFVHVAQFIPELAKDPSIQIVNFVSLPKFSLNSVANFSEFTFETTPYAVSHPLMVHTSCRLKFLSIEQNRKSLADVLNIPFLE